MSHNSSIFTWESRVGLVLILILIIVSGSGPVVSMISSWCKDSASTCRCDSTKLSIHYPYFTDIDEKLEKKKFRYGDSVMIENLWKNQKYIFSQQDNLLADVRQETNNSIEKITSELNFWVAILAFLGVLVPIAITHKGENEARNWLEKKESVYDEKIRNAVVGMQLKIKEQSEQNSRIFEELKEWKANSDKEFKARGEEQEQLIQELKLQREVETMNCIRNNRFIETDNELKLAYDNIAKQLVGDFLNYLKKNIDKYSTDNDQDVKKVLIRMSMLFFDVLYSLKLNHTDPVRPRALYLAEDSVKSLIKELLIAIPDRDNLKAIFKDVNKNVARVLDKL